MVELKTLSKSQLEKLLDEYPWFSAARAEYILRQGGESRNGDAIRAAAEKSGLFFLARRDFNKILERKIAGDRDVVLYAEDYPEPECQSRVKKGQVPGGDYFRKEDFVQLEKDGLAVKTPVLKASAAGEEEDEVLPELPPKANPEDDFYTETLAEIYIEQQFYQRAIAVYKKLILLYPEKSAYFASLIEKVEKLKQK